MQYLCTKGDPYPVQTLMPIHAKALTYFVAVMLNMAFSCCCFFFFHKSCLN